MFIAFAICSEQFARTDLQDNNAIRAGLYSPGYDSVDARYSCYFSMLWLGQNTLR